MKFKILKSLLWTGCDFSYLSISRNISFKLLQSRSCIRFFSEESDSKSDPKKDLKGLLGDASPLKPSSEVENLWATSPYPEGTVFSDSESETLVENTSILMFPGQGNQFVGMADNIIKYGVVQDMFDSASEILGYNLLKVCTNGPIEKLNKTEYCQPATLVCSLGAVEKLKDEKPWAIDQCNVVCGYSLGELTALTLAGCMSFERAVKLVKIRAELMSECCKMAKGGMMAVLYGPASKLSEAISDACAHCSQNGIENPVCDIAVYLYPNCKIIGGHMIALNYISENLSKYNLKKLSVLPVEGAFHTYLMKDAEEPFKKALLKVEFNKPIVRVYSNVIGKTYQSVSQIKNLLPKQIYSPVKWEQIMKNTFKKYSPQTIPYSYECGPGKSLITVLKKINPKAFQCAYAVRL